jgi:purine catabolism regulator
MRLSDAITCSSLGNAALVGGGTSLEQDVLWVQVVDHPDIVEWVEAGHLLLSTGYNWPRDDDGACNIVERLAAKGACGVVLAVPHFLDHFPAASIEAAQRTGLALLELPWEVPFSQITQAILRELIDEKGRALAQSDLIHRQLTQAAIASDSIGELAAVLARVLGKDVAFADGDGCVLAFAAAQPDSAVAEDGLKQWVADPGVLAGIDAAPNAVRLRASPATGTSQPEWCAGCSIRIGAAREGYVFLRDNTVLSSVDLRALEHASTVAALQISRQRELLASESRLGYALVAALIEGRFDATPQSLERARLAGWDATARYRVVTILLNEPNPLTSDGFRRREELAGLVKNFLSHRRFKALICLSANTVQFLAPDELDVREFWDALPHKGCGAAVSQAYAGVSGMVDAGSEMTQFMHQIRPGKLQCFEDTLFPRVLNGDAAAREVMMHRIIAPLEDGKREALLSTALALAAEGFHLQNASTRLGVHISTLRYRIDRIAELTGLDLATVDGRFQLQFAARIQGMRDD